MRLPVFIGIAALAICLCQPNQAEAFIHDNFGEGPGWPNRVDDHIDSLYAVSPFDTVNIIVDFCYEPGQPESLFLSTFGTVYEVFGFINAVAVRQVRVQDCYGIIGYPGVKLIEWDEIITPHIDISCPATKARGSVTYPYPSQAAWALNPPRGFMGNGINIVIMDSGVDDGHPALAGKFVAGYDAITRTGGVNPDDDMVGWYHGTAVAGMAMANDPAQQYMGTAPGALLTDVKIFGPPNFSSPASRTINAISWCIRNRAVFGIDIINMSFGGRAHDGTDAVSRATNAAAAVGIVPVASVGNTPPSTSITAPGTADDAITVGGISDNGTIGRGDDWMHPISVPGPRPAPPPLYTMGINELKPEVCAYVDAITTCLGTNPGQAATGWWQHPGTGTSWATGHVSGIVACVLEAFPGTSPQLVEMQLRATAEARGTPAFPWIDPIYDTQWGWGIVDAGAAVNTPFPTDVSIANWIPGNWTSKGIWPGHYPLKVGDPNTLNARITANGGPAPGVVVNFEMMWFGWGGFWTFVGTTTVNIPGGGSTVATIPFTPVISGHKCIRVTAVYPPDTNPNNNSAQQNMDIQPAGKKKIVGGKQIQHYAYSLQICVEPECPYPFRTADACICKKDLPPEADAWIEPGLPVDLTPGECFPCSLIIEAPDTVDFTEDNAVYVNGWFWGNGVAEAGVQVRFDQAPPMDVTIAEIQYTDDPSGKSPLMDQRVRVSGVATSAEIEYPGRIAMQDGDGPWNGIFFDDPGLGIQRGDSLTVTSFVNEMGGLTVLSPMMDIVVHGPAGSVPDVYMTSPSEVDTSEGLEGVLVGVEGAKVVQADDPAADWEVSGSDTCWVGHWAGYSYMPFVGDSVNLTGIVGSMDSLYKIQPRDDADIEVYFVGVGPGDVSVAPKVVSLTQNYPNPFNPSTEISYALPADAEVTLGIYNVSGQLVRTLIDGHQEAGYHRVIWDGYTDSGTRAASGVYFYSLKTGKKTVTKRMVLLK
jgi:subtilisin family serine protease